MKESNDLSKCLRGFFQEYLPKQRGVSAHTIHSYRDSLKLLLQYLCGEKRIPLCLNS